LLMPNLCPAQEQQATQVRKPPVFPANMDCEKLKGDKEVPFPRPRILLDTEL
jgi:hypothetical protein